MFTAFKKTALPIVLACCACLLAPASSALAGAGITGGVSGAQVSGPSAGPGSRRAALATWFGPGFYGRRTACGQLLSPAVLGLANRTLPCGTLVNVSFGSRHLVLPVIDRGPYANGAQWDLTFGAARALGMTDTARIATRIVGSARNTPALGQPPGQPILAAAGPTGGTRAG
jgi:rare lipoprotein A (peptidoglycan hydrolase)